MPKQMLKFMIFAGCLLFAVASVTAESITPLTLRGQLIDTFNQPVADTTVLLVGLARENMMNIEAAAHMTNFHTQTDAEGKYEFHIGIDSPAIRVFSAEDVESQKLQDFVPGPGDYTLVVEPGKNHAGAISPRIIFNEGSHEGYKTDMMPMLFTRGGTLEVNMSLRPGGNLRGRVIDQEGKPMAWMVFEYHHDLHLGSHTGYGGEIWKRKFLTDAKGFFNIEGICPDRKIVLTPYLGNSDNFYWLETRMGLKADWVEDRIDEIDLTEMGDAPYLEIRGARYLTYGVKGRVSDPQQQPLTGVMVHFGFAAHNANRTYGDYHQYKQISTYEEGWFEFWGGTPWLTYIRLEKEGYRDVIVEDFDSGIFENDQGFTMTPVEKDGSAVQ